MASRPGNNLAKVKAIASSVTSNLGLQRTNLALIGKLLKRKNIEEQLAGVLLYEKKFLKVGDPQWRADLHYFAKLFDDGVFNQIELVDRFAKQVLSRLITQCGSACASEIALWGKAPNRWKKRASIIALDHALNRDGSTRVSAAKTALWVLR